MNRVPRRCVQVVCPEPYCIISIYRNLLMFSCLSAIKLSLFNLGRKKVVPWGKNVLEAFVEGFDVGAIYEVTCHVEGGLIPIQRPVIV